MAEVPGAGQLAAAGLASVALGFVGRLVALRLGAPGLVLVVPAWPTGCCRDWRSSAVMYEMVAGSRRPRRGRSRGHQGGITTLLGAMAVLLAIATGAVLGETMASPLDRRIISQRRARRR